MWCSLVFVCVVTVLGLLALFATPVIGAEWDDPSPPKPQPGTALGPNRHHGEHADAEPLRGLGEDELFGGGCGVMSFDTSR